MDDRTIEAELRNARDIQRDILCELKVGGPLDDLLSDLKLMYDVTDSPIVKTIYHQTVTMVFSDARARYPYALISEDLLLSWALHQRLRQKTASDSLTPVLLELRGIAETTDNTLLKSRCERLIQQFGGEHRAKIR